VRDIVLVTSRTKHAVEDHFDIGYELEDTLRKRGKTELADQMSKLSHLVNLIAVRQKEPLGLGHAVLCAREAVGERPFVMIWGDDIVLAREPVASQLLAVRDRSGGGSVAAVVRVPERDARKYGVIEGDQVGERTWRVRRIVEKPDRPLTSLAAVHAYALEPEIFDVLAAMPPGRGGEIWLSEAVSALAQRAPVYAYEFEGDRFDAGDRAGYVKAIVASALERPEMAADLKEWLRSRL
jgi:UTP--glucose-1-phosphate uridylyltransferase